MERRLMLTLVLFASVLCLFFDTASSQRTGSLSAYKISSFQQPDINAKLNHVLRHSQSGNVYVGAVNSIYRLNNDLEHQRNVSTAFNGCKRYCANHNKVLFVEPLRNALITCGSYTDESYRGQCQLRHVEELTVTAKINNLVASDEDKTTLGILAPGPGNRDWLYVVATFTSSFPRNTVPPVSRRHLGLEVPDAHLLFANEDSRVTFAGHYKSDPFDISYVYGFSSNGYVYYVTNQNGFSKVVRICHHQADVPEWGRQDLSAYTEITIQCGQGSNVYPSAQAAYVGPAGPGIAASLGIDSSDLMLYAVFTKEDNSALCMFSMGDIEHAFVIAVSNCIRGTGGDSVSYLEGSRCSAINVPDIIPFLCGTGGAFKYPNNPNAVESSPMLTQEGISMSSITTTIESNHIVAFIGTSSGSLIKVHIEGGTSARHYESINLGDASVLRDISLDDTKQHIFVLTEQQLLKLRVENCSQYTSCETCIGPDGDPYCGWCTLENKCTRRDDCTMADESNHWLPYNEIGCVAISDIVPYRSFPITEPQRPIVLTVEHLPKLQEGETYSCKFNDLPVYQGTTTGNTVTCNIPETTARPNIPSDEDHVEMQLSVVSSVSRAFVSTEFVFYQCSWHNKCGECVTSDWDCDWCVFDNTCTHQSSLECSTEDTIIIGLNNPTGGANQGPEFCPQLQLQDGEVLVPVDIQREILVNVSNLPDSNTLNYECSLLVDNVKQSVQATKVSSDVIKCNSRPYTYEADDVNEFLAQLSISWNGDRELDDYYTFSVTLYKCHVDRPDCSRCLFADTARPELNCRWCGTQCANIDNTVCSNGAVEPGGQCPAPHLEKIDPVSGPMEGNTVIKVIGTNIGQRFEDVRSVMVGQQSCDLTGLEDQYVTGQSVSCRTAPISSSNTNDVTVSVSPVDGGADLQSTGKVDFIYTNPMIVNFHPRIGPEAGGTQINIIGVNMNTGTDIKAMIDTNVPCVIIRRNNTAILCTTAASMVGTTGLITVTFDGALRTSTDNFTFQPNPMVTDIQPRKSIKSGGRELTISGTDFVVSTAAIFVRHKDIDDNGMENMFEESCQAQNDSTLVCTSPAIKLPDTMTSPCTDVTVGFQLDGFKMILKTPAFKYCLDPTFSTTEDLKVSDRNSLQIQGERLKLAADTSDVWVTVGDKNCTVTELYSILLMCTLPKERPSGSNNAMVVRWYGNLTFHLGEVTYPFDVVTLLIVIISSVAIPLLLLSAIFAAMYFRQRTILKGHHDRLLNRIRDFHEEIQNFAEATRKASLSTERPGNIHQHQSIVINSSISIVPGDIQIKFNQLEIGRLLGQGAVGKVYKAVLKDTPTGTRRTVTVKTASDGSDPSNVIKFLEEGLIMKNFDHPNVLGLIGLTFDPQGQPLIVLPYMENGDLKSYLRTHNPDALTVLNFALDVARGMEYLSKRKFVHRDLAARNCLVDYKLIVKVGDFGLSRDLNEDDYYTSDDRKAKLPIKWLAPESMERLVYNTKTDMWSYGVLLWELFTGGQVPYPGLLNMDVYDYLKRGERMKAPKFCHKKIYEIMKSCWNDSPKKRCSYQQVIKVLNEVMAIITGNFSPLDLDSDDEDYLIPLKLMKGSTSAEAGKSRGKCPYINVTTEMWN